MVGKFLLMSAMGLTFAYVYPIWNEGAHSTCQALESRFIAMAAPLGPTDPTRPLGHLLEQAVLRTTIEPLSSGRIAAAEIKDRYPALPSDIGCAVGYWTLLLDPQVQQAIRQAVQ